jgi:hypothetical protein
MGFISENRTYIFFGVFIVILIMYYVLDYQIRWTIKDELKVMKEKKYKKLKMIKHKKMKEQKNTFNTEESSHKNAQQIDMDSYMDPLLHENNDNQIMMK